MNFNLRFYWSLFLHRLPAMLALVILCSALGMAAAMNLPPSYSTSARLLVEAPQIPDEMAASTVRTDPGEQLQIIEQRLLTRANLIDIANKFSVFPEIRAMSPDAVVEAMRGATAVRRSGGRGEATLMTISFSASDGQTAANVVNEYVTLILQTNSEFRLSRVENTLAFFEQEVEQLATDLDRQSARIVEFKNNNAEALPDDLDYRLGRQALLQERLGRIERDRAAALIQRGDVIKIFQATGQIRPMGEAAVALSPEEQQLNALRGELDRALAIYSESNPRIRLLRIQIAQLETRVQAQALVATDTGATEPASLLDVTLAEIDARVSALDQEIAEVATELETLEASIAATSSNGIALNALERDYENIQTRYTAAVNNLNAARMGERIEMNAQGQRITVIEAASAPVDPSGPNRTAIATAGIGAGLGLAAGLFVLLEILNRTIRRPAELQGRFGISPLVAIPYLESRAERRLRRGALVGAFLAVLFGMPALLWYIDANHMPLEVLANRVISRLGLS